MSLGSFRSLMLIGSFSAISLLGQTPQPPVAPLIEHRETRYGTTVVDNYFWLRERLTGKWEVMGSSVGLVPRNAALVTIDCAASQIVG
jgi:hypothetical protein